MESEIIMLDTSVLIDFFRKKDKSKSYFFQLSARSEQFCVSSITLFEILNGASSQTLPFWKKIFAGMQLLSFDESCAEIAARMDVKLRKSRNQIGIADLFIAASSVRYGCSLATLNRKHFERVADLELVSP